MDRRSNGTDNHAVSTMLTRRKVLARMALAAGGVVASSLLQACGGGASAPTATAPAAPTTSQGVGATPPALTPTRVAGSAAASGTVAPQTTGATPAAGPPQKGGQIIVGISQEPQNFNPILPWTDVQRWAHAALFDSLWRIGPKGEFLPNLAAEIPTTATGGISADGLTFTIKLRKDAKWHDGQPFTAKDVVFTWNTILNPNVTSYSTVGFDQIASMTAPDDATVVFKLKAPYAPIMATLADMFIIPEHILAKSADINKDAFNTKKPIGTGPFTFVEWVAGDHMTFAGNKSYHGPGPYLDRLIFKYIPDLTVLFTQFKTGEIDITGIQGITVDHYQEAKALPNINLFVSTGTTTEFVCLNFLNPLFQDKQVRQALYYGMDKKPVVQDVFLGLVPEAETYVPPESWAYDPKVKGAHSYDPAKAKQLLEAAGWKVGSDGVRVKDGQRLSFENGVTAGNKPREQNQQVLQQQWKQIGVEMKINNLPAAVIFGDFFRLSKFQTIFNGIAMGPDPDFSYRMDSHYIPVKGGNGRNSVAYSNPQMDALLAAGVRELDQEKRKAIYAQIQELFVDDLPYLPIYHYVGISATKAAVQGYVPNANASGGTWNVNEWWVKK